MKNQLWSLLAETDALVKKTMGAVSSTVKDIRKEILYLSEELDIAKSADNRDAIFSAIGKKISKLQKRMQGIVDYQNAKAVDFASKEGKAQTGIDVKISKKVSRQITETVEAIGGGNMAAVMTQAMNRNIVSALRDATMASIREQSINGLTMKELQNVMKQKWQAAAKDEKNLQFVDKSGRVWNTDTYINMSARTNATLVYNEAMISYVTQATGSDLMMISSGGDINCPLCYPWEGRIISISGKTKGFPTYAQARAAGVFHPNCVHTLDYVDAEIDAEEIDLQRGFPFPTEGEKYNKEQLATTRFNMDVARKMQTEGMDATQAKIAVSRDNLETSIRQGLIMEDAAKVVNDMSDAQVNALVKNGRPPEFLPVKDNNGVSAWNHGKNGGKIYLDKKGLTAERVVEVTGIQDGKPVAKSEPPKRSFVGNLASVKNCVTACNKLLSVIQDAKNKAELFAAKVEAAEIHVADNFKPIYGQANAEKEAIQSFQPVTNAVEDLLETVKITTPIANEMIANMNAIALPSNPEEQEKANDTAANGIKTVEQHQSDIEKKIGALDALFKTANDKATALFVSAATVYLSNCKQSADSRAQIVNATENEIAKYSKEITEKAVGHEPYPKAVADFFAAYNVAETTIKMLNLEKSQFDDAYKVRNIVEASKEYSEYLNAFADANLDIVKTTVENAYHVAVAELEKLKPNEEQAEEIKAKPKRGRKPKVNPVANFADYDFPKTLTAKMFDDALRSGKSLGGTTGAKLVEINGKKYMMKRGSGTSDAHVENEMSANKAYRAAGILAPDCKVYKVNGETVALTQYVEGGRTLGDYMKTATAKQKADVIAQLRKGFAVDALFANHDVLGTGGDNVLIDGDGKVWRIDNGSAFGFRAQGARKSPKLWDERKYLDDLWSMRDDNLAPMKGVFSKMTSADIMRDALDIDLDNLAKSLPKEIAAKLKTAIRELDDLRKTCKSYDDGGFIENEVEASINLTHEFARTGIGERVDNIPKLSRRSDAKALDHYRHAITQEMMQFTGANYEFIARCSSEQAGNSWRHHPCKEKIMINEMLGFDSNPNNAKKVGTKTYMGADGQVMGVSDLSFGRYTEAYNDVIENPKIHEANKEAFRRYRLATQYVLRHGKFNGVDFSGTDFVACRTEASPKFMNLEEGEAGIVHRGGCESTAFITNGFGVHMTTQTVPISRINGCYIFSRYGLGDSLYLGDKENEMTVSFTGLKTKTLFQGKVRRGRSLAPLRELHSKMEAEGKF